MVRRQWRFVALTLTLGVSACINQGVQPLDDESEGPILMTSPLKTELEPVKNPRVQGEELVFSVVSFGCTKSSDFNINTSVVEGQCEVELVRSVRDMCKRAAKVTAVRLEWTPPSDCQGLPVVFKNPALER